MAPVLIQARFTFMKNKYHFQNKMGFFAYIYVIVTSDMGFHKLIVCQCTCTMSHNVLRIDMVITS